ncbi:MULTISPECIES: type VII secretion protein [Streptococcus]|jgi:yukD|uniref:Type VII secretion protein n=2 Tax=Streptococcus oralis TaxID=1303 RepID=A0A1X1IKS2_STROR|nr:MULTISPECIES: type VII secretion protein [Streptococcus]AHZ47103.1 type VII secretion protein [Streptococcus sp. VT 162]MDU5072988.1 type VII secretion protein [Streptococcus sp.]ORO50035.1 type VII secretion protein [Streptococcus oralis subsp. oralis]ORO68983.1 type VII secretion protein [Streptococcus oralis subsp. oralis]ORO73782.1 type VII secretion protein [Streptococcus oralis subsp. oralis]
MEEYINISLDCSPFLSKILDLRVPTELTIKELLQIVSDTYGIGVKVMNPSVRNQQSGEILASTSSLALVKDGVLLKLERI